MPHATVLEPEEYIEQTYFFRVFRKRMEQSMPSQEILVRLRDEVLSTTRLPFAIDFLATEMKHSGVLASAMEQLGHYFTPFQAFVVEQAEAEGSRFSMDLALTVLEREAAYKASGFQRAGLFVYQFETLSRNRLGYELGLQKMAADPLYDAAWSDWILKLRFQLGSVDFADLVYARSEQAQIEARRGDADYQPRHPVLFGAKEGRIARANHGKDPLYLFAALQRQLGYPEVPRPERPDPQANLLLALDQKVQQLEARLKLLEDETKGGIDLSQFYVKKEPGPGAPP